MIGRRQDLQVNVCYFSLYFTLIFYDALFGSLPFLKIVLKSNNGLFDGRDEIFKV